MEEQVSREPQKYEVTLFDNSPQNNFSWERG